MSLDEGNALRRDLRQVEQTLRSDRASQAEEREQLRSVLEQATALLSKNSADAGAELDRLRQQVSLLRGAADEASQSLRSLSTKVAALEAKSEKASNSDQSRATLPTTNDALFELGLKRFNEGIHDEARRSLRRFIAKFPSDPRISRAIRLLGDSYFKQERFAPAIQEYRRIVEKHKTSRETPNALFQIGRSFYQLKYCTDAKLFLTELLKHRGKKPYQLKTRKILTLIKRNRRNRRICIS